MDIVAGIQSALQPHGPQAAAVVTLTWVLVTGAAAILLLVVGLTLYALLGNHKRRAWAASNRFIIAGGVVFPVVTLTALLVYSLLLTRDLVHARKPPALHVEVVAHQWWWRIHYLDERGGIDFVTANEIRIPAGKPVHVALKSADVIHSFSVPNLAGKVDMIPGRTNALTLQATRPGVFRGQCAEYCGGPHAKMAFYVIAEDDAGFDAWRRRQRGVASISDDPLAQRGRALFLSHCAACHAVRGTPANGTLGPDLTHVGGRTHIAAGMLPMNSGTLAAWIVASQRIKPENLMPSMDVFSGEELRALAAYLEGLK